MKLLQIRVMVYKFLDWYTSFRVQVLHLAVLWISSKWFCQYCILKIFLPNFFLPIHTPSIITASSTLKKKNDLEISLSWPLYIKSKQMETLLIYVFIHTVWLFYSFYQKLKKGKGTFPFHNETRGQQALKVTWVHIAHKMNCQGISCKHF